MKKWATIGKGPLDYILQLGADVARSRPVLVSVLTALCVGLLSAVAVDQGFGPGFIDDAVGYPAVIYACFVTAVVTRLRANAAGGIRGLVANLMSHGSVGAIVLVLLRTVARVELPIGRYSTTGHYPYFAVPVACTLAQLGWELLSRRATQRASDVKA